MDPIKSISLLTQLWSIIHVFFALVAGAIIGWEREVIGKEAGIRTFGLISAGACCFVLIADVYSPDSAARIIANIVVGIGFITGGIVTHQTIKDAQNNNGVGISHGFTTAASLWVTAALGTMIGLRLYLLAIAVLCFTLLLLHIPTNPIWKYLSNKRKG